MKKLSLDELREALKRKVRCYHANLSEEDLNDLSLNGLYSKVHPLDRKDFESEMSIHVSANDGITITNEEDYDE